MDEINMIMDYLDDIILDIENISNTSNSIPLVCAPANNKTHENLMNSPLPLHGNPSHESPLITDVSSSRLTLSKWLNDSADEYETFDFAGGYSEGGAQDSHAHYGDYKDQFNFFNSHLNGYMESKLKEKRGYNQLARIKLLQLEENNRVNGFMNNSELLRQSRIACHPTDDDDVSANNDAATAINNDNLDDLSIEEVEQIQVFFTSLKTSVRTLKYPVCSYQMYFLLGNFDCSHQLNRMSMNEMAYASPMETNRWMESPDLGYLSIVRTYSCAQRTLNSLIKIDLIVNTRFHFAELIKISVDPETDLIMSLINKFFLVIGTRKTCFGLEFMTESVKKYCFKMVSGCIDEIRRAKALQKCSSQSRVPASLVDSGLSLFKTTTKYKSQPNLCSLLDIRKPQYHTMSTMLFDDVASASNVTATTSAAAAALPGTVKMRKKKKRFISSSFARQEKRYSLSKADISNPCMARHISSLTSIYSYLDTNSNI